MNSILEKFKNYLPEIENIFKENIISVTIYGSIVKGNFIPKKSDLNVLIICKKNIPEQFIKFSPLFLKLNRKINFYPLILTKNEIKNSADIFPMEFSDIKEHHITLKGKDIFKNLKIENKYLRLELETQIKGKLILLKESLLKFAKNKKNLKNIMLNSIPSIIIILKNVLILNKIKNSISIDAIISKAEFITKIKFDTLKKLIKIKNSNEKISSSEILKIYSQYLKEIESLSNYIDKFKTSKLK